MKTFQLNSELCPLVYVDMYDSPLSPLNFEEVDDAFGNPFVRSIVDIDSYDRCVRDFCQEFLDTEILPVLSPYGVKKITALSIDHPREYNFTTDALIFNVEMADGWKKTMRDHLQQFRDKPGINDYIRDHYFSRSGFISFMPQSCQEIMQMEDEDRCLAAYLTLALIDYDEFFFKGDMWGKGILDRFECECVEYLTEHQGDFLTEINFLHPYTDEQTAEKLCQLYDDRHGKLEAAVSRAFAEFGLAWKWDKFSTLTFEDEQNYERLDADNEAMRCIIWAVKEKHTDLLLQTA